MPSKGVNVAVTVVVAFLLGAWMFTGCLVVIAGVVSGADMGWWTIFLAAPIAVPLLTLQQPDRFMFVWLVCVMLTSFVIYRLLRRSFALRPAGQPADSANGPGAVS